MICESEVYRLRVCGGLSIGKVRRMATTSGNDTIVGVFHNQEDARRAIASLKEQGYTENEIGVISQHGEVEVSEGTGTAAGEGALAGAAAGAGVGALWGLGILSNVLPGIGPAIFGGTLGILLSSAAAGAAAAGIGGALMGMGFSDEDARYYEDEVKSGRTIVTVRGGANRARAQNVFDQYGGYNRASLVRPDATVR